MPWPRNPLSAKDRAKTRKGKSRDRLEDYTEQQNAERDAIDNPQVTGYNADRRAWQVSTQGGQIYAPAQTFGAVANGALIPGAGLVYREAIASSVAATPVPAILSEDPIEPTPVYAGLATLHAFYLYKESSVIEAEETGRVILGWSHNETWQTVLQVADPYFGGQILASHVERVIPLTQDEAIVIVARSVPSSVVPPSGAYRMSIFLVHHTNGVSRTNYQWTRGQIGTNFEYDPEDEWAKFKPVQRFGTNGDLTVDLELGIEAETGYPYHQNEGSLFAIIDNNFSAIDKGCFFGETEEYFRIAPILQSDPRFPSAIATYPNTQPLFGYNILSDDPRTVYKADGNSWEEVGETDSVAPPPFVPFLVPGISLGSYYFAQLTNNPGGSLGVILVTSFGTLGAYRANNEAIIQGTLDAIAAHEELPATNPFLFNGGTQTAVVPYFRNNADIDELVTDGWSIYPFQRAIYRTEEES